MSAKAPGWTSPRPHGRAAERRCLPRLWLNDAVQSQRHFLSGLNFLGSKGSEATSAPIRQTACCVQSHCTKPGRSGEHRGISVLPCRAAPKPALLQGLVREGCDYITHL